MQEQNPAKPAEKMGLSRGVMAAGFMIIMLGVGIGAATDGSPWAKYIALAGAVAIGVSIVLTIVEKLNGKIRNRTQQTA